MAALRSEKLVHLASALGFAALAGTMLHVLIHFSGFIYRFYANSFFNDTWAWFAAHFDKPAALVLYAGRFLTQFCKFPVVAALLLIGLYAAISLLVWRYFLRGRKVSLLAAFPALALFVSLMRTGYGVLIFHADALIFTEPLGILAALALFQLLRIGEGKVRWAVALIGFPLAGCYALLALLIHSAWSLAHEKGQARLVRPMADLALVALVPWVEYLLIYDHSVLRYIWFEGAPFRDYVDNPLGFIPLVVAALLPVIFAALPSRAVRPSRLWHLAPTALVAAGAIVCVYLLPYRDSLFHKQMEVERAIARGEWSTVAEKTFFLRVTNDVLISYRNCALYVRGRLEEDCMKYSFSTVPVTIGGKEYGSSILAGPAIFFHSGLLNYAARCASEISLYTNYSVERWQYLAKVAIFNGQRELAEKYLQTIGHTTFDKAWARRYRSLLEDPELLAEDPEFRRLMPLQDYVETGWMPSDNASSNVLMFYYYIPGNSPEMQTWNRAARKMVVY